MINLEGKRNGANASSDREDDYWTFVNDVRYPPGTKPNFYKTSPLAYILFLWVGKFAKTLVGSESTFLDYPPQPNSASIRQRQFETFSVINAHLARYKVELSKNKGRNTIPRFTLRAIFVVFWDKILFLLTYSISIAVLDYTLLLVIKRLMRSLSTDDGFNYVPVLYICAIIVMSFMKTLFIQHKFFSSDRYQLSVTASMSYALFRLGVSRRKEYHNCNCCQGTYAYGIRRRCLRKRDGLYMRHFEMQLKALDDNKCEQGSHVAVKGRINSLCPAQQGQGYELSNSIYTFFVGDTRSVCKILHVMVNMVELFIQLGFTWYSIYTEIGNDHIWATAFQISVLLVAVIIKFSAGALKKIYLPAVDRRVYSSYELCANVKSIIMQGLEHASSKFLSKRRRAETRPLFLELFLNYFFEWLSTIVQQVSITSTILVMMYNGKASFGADKAITVIHGIKIVQSYIYDVPNILGILIEAMVSMSRLDVYFSERRPETGPTVLGFSSNCESKHGFKLNFEKATFNYGQEGTPCLKELDLQLKAGEILVLCGHTGSGKSSLIKACMGELTLSSGKMSVSSLMHGRPIYYVPQKPWIPAGTFMSAVLDGNPYDKDSYTTAITAAELCRDVDEWEKGHDRTFDENATSLSGGQRMRLTLARTIYAFLISHPRGTPRSRTTRSDLVCLDGVFPNLDLPVSMKIFQNLFGQNGIFTHGDACVILTMEFSKLKICFELLRELRLPLHNFKVCELEEGGIISNSSVDEYIRLETPRSSRQLKPQTLENKEQAQDQSTVIEDYLDLKRMQVRLLPLCKKYFSYAGRIKLFIAILLLLVAYCVRSVLNIIIISWSNQIRKGPISKEETKGFIIKLLAFTVTEVCTKFVGTLLWWYCGINAARKYHDQRINSLLFNKEIILKPIGKYLTEFTIDQYNIDTKVHLQSIIAFSMTIQLGFQIGSIAYIFPYAVISFIIVNVIAYFAVVGYYIKSTRHARFNMLESLTGINLVISQAIHGGELIRAFGREHVLFKNFLTKSDYYYRTTMFRYNICNWAIVRYGMFNFVFFTLFILTPMLISIFLTDKEHRIPGNLGYVLSLFITTNSTTSHLLFNIGVLSEYLLSLASSHTSLELPPTSRTELRNPSESLLDIRDIVVYHKSYNPQNGQHSTSLCINGISSTAEKGDIIGIVGRTGSGKTSFLQSIRGMLFFDSGTIYIDGISIEDMPDDTLRETIGFISQYNFYFEGWTLLDFIDPYKRYTNADIQWALNELDLLDIVLNEVPKITDDESDESRLERALQTQLATQSNYAISARRMKKKKVEQLNLNSSHLYHISFARLLLGRLKYKVILIDEPPNIVQSSAEPMPLLLKEFINKYLGHCATVIVTHDYGYAKICSKLWVLNKGKIVEQLTPENINSQMKLLRLLE